jgi:hypothetical protein
MNYGIPPIHPNQRPIRKQHENLADLATVAVEVQANREVVQAAQAEA